MIRIHDPCMIHATRRKGMVGMVGMDKTKPWTSWTNNLGVPCLGVTGVRETFRSKVLFSTKLKDLLISWSFLCQLQANAEWICYQTGHTNQQPSQDHDDGASRGQAGVLNWLVHQLLFHPWHRDPWGHFIHCEPLLSKKPVWGDADFKTSLSGIGQANPSNKEWQNVMSVYWFQTAHMRSQGQLSLTKWQLHAWCLRIHPWGCRWLQCQNVFGEQFPQFDPISEIFRQFSDSYCASLVAFAKHLDWTLPPKWCGIKRDKRDSPDDDPTLSWGQRGRHNQMTQMTLCCRTRSAWILSKWSQLILFSEQSSKDQSCGVSVGCIKRSQDSYTVLHCPTLSYTSMGSGWDPKPRPYGPASHCCGGSGTFSSVTASASFLIQGLCHHLIHLGVYHVYGIWHMGT